MRWSIRTSIPSSRSGFRDTPSTSCDSPASSKWTSSAVAFSMAASETKGGTAQAEIPQGSRHDLRHGLTPDAPETETYSDEEGAFGYVHSYETGSRLDGPGVRLTLFVSGCPLRCQYCHNPDTWRLKDGVRVSAEQAIKRL